MESIIKTNKSILIINEKVKINKKRKTIKEYVSPVSKSYNLDYDICRKLCREIKLTTNKTIEQAIKLVKRNLKQGMNINEIISKYSLERDCIF